MSTSFTYLGGPTGVLEYAGLRFLLDPTFDDAQTYDDPGSTPLVKTQGPALGPAAIGRIDVVLASHHEHPDNLDAGGREFAMDSPLVLSTPEAAADLGDPVVGLAPWEQHRTGQVTVTGMPALHGPPGSEEFVGPVVGFLLEADNHPSVYVSGDNASLDLVEEIATRHAPIGVAVLFAGAARVPAIDAPLTLTSADAVAAARMLGVRQVVGIHVEDWKHFSESRADLEAAFAAAGLADLLVRTPRGEQVPLGTPLVE
jgi:L-ascorbate metabolism protein UlaG (beta-lactamase superfamily)